MSKPLILVVDDEPAILATVTDILEDEGYQVMRAANGAEGLARLEEVFPDLVLLDIRMPVLDGWGFARAVQARGLQVPVVVMSAGQETRAWAQEITAAA